MATTPRRTQHTPPQDYTSPPDPEEPEVKTIGQEQLERSREIEDQGVEPWKAEHDQRRGRQQQVAGIGRTEIDDGDEYPGTPTTPPEGHDERQHGPGEPGGPTAGHYPMPGEPGGGDVEAENEASQRPGQDRRDNRREDRQSRR